MDEFDPKKAATDLVAAFVSNNTLAAEQLPALLASVFSAVTAFGAPPEEPAAAEVYTPKVSVRASTRDPNFIVSLISGEKLKTLKRHLSRHGLTPAEYRERYNLPRDYPMVAPAYSDHRRAVAQQMGLGRRSVATPAAADATPMETPAAAPVRKAAKKPAAAAAQPAPAPVAADKPRRSRKLSLAFGSTASPAAASAELAPAETMTQTPAKPKPARKAPRKADAATGNTPALPAKTPVRRTRKTK